MKTAVLPSTIPLHFTELNSYPLLEALHEDELNDFVQLVSQICKTSLSVLTIIDRSQYCSKSVVGLKEVSDDKNASFYSYSMFNDDLLEEGRALTDEHFFDNIIADKKSPICFFACMPLINSKNQNFGALCVIDTIPHSLTAEQSSALKLISKQIVTLIEQRLVNKQIMYASEAQERIISLVSHDVRGPLNSIKAFLEMHAEQPFSQQEIDTMLSILNINITRTLQLLDNLVDWGKIQLQYKRESAFVNLSNLVNECIEEAELSILLKNNKILNNVDPAINLNTDREGVHFILRNLISNANKFTENGIIEITDNIKENSTVYLCVKDNGVGIEVNKLNQILKEYGMYHTDGTQHEKGSGLGLSLIRNYLRKTGNEIQITSDLHKGTSVCFSITNN